jgi:hypothetical protein
MVTKRSKGFGQSADFFKMKMRRITKYLEETLDQDLLSSYPEGIEWLFPDGPVALETDTLRSDGVRDIDMRAWWTKLDTAIRIDQLYSSLDYLTSYLREHGPVDGIIGFSQGASMAMMLTALCEGSSRPERIAALANQGIPLLIPPPQAPFKFAIACSGFRNSPQFYNGFYSPSIVTPSMHVVADWDHMVSVQMSADIIDACVDAVVMRHPGTHAVPTDRRSMSEMSKFMNNACVKAVVAETATLGQPLRRASLVTHATLTLTAYSHVPGGEHSTAPSLTHSSSPADSHESSPASSISESSMTSASKKRRPRFARRVVVRRYM